MVDSSSATVSLWLRITDSSKRQLGNSFSRSRPARHSLPVALVSCPCSSYASGWSYYAGPEREHQVRSADSMPGHSSSSHWAPATPTCGWYAATGVRLHCPVDLQPRLPQRRLQAHEPHTQGPGKVSAPPQVGDSTPHILLLVPQLISLQLKQAALCQNHWAHGKLLHARRAVANLS
mgnify:CR=1 FL=1